MPGILDDPLYQRAAQAGQSHIFRFWDALAEDEKRALYNQVSRIDFNLLARALEGPQAILDFATVEPGQAALLSAAERLTARQAGDQAIRDGQVCPLVLAGGQGTRLGYPYPKGMFPIGPISGMSLFEWFAAKIQFFNDRCRAPIPWLVMTSPATDADTRAFFERRAYFGLGPENVFFFSQGLLPVIDFQGRLLMDAPGHICESPDGHGGVISALGEAGLLDELARRGVRHIFIHNVDNCLARLLDPAFIGCHIQSGADMSLKCLEKSSPGETLGTLVKTAEGPRVIEYSDTPPDIAAMRDENGRLVYGTGSINTYLLRLDFIERLYRDRSPLPCHITRRAVPALDESGKARQPQTPNAIKLETKLFDAMQYAWRINLLIADRSEEFSPLKSGQGRESAESVASDLRAMFLNWLEDAGISVDRERVGAVEISPLFAIDRDAFLEKAARMGRGALLAEVIRQTAATGQIRL